MEKGHITKVNENHYVASYPQDTEYTAIRGSKRLGVGFGRTPLEAIRNIS